MKALIIGTSASGKTTLSKYLAELTDSNAFDLDDYWWLPGWVKQEERFVLEKLQEIEPLDSWVVSGNHEYLLRHMWKKADTIIWLDYPLLTLLYRGFKRTFRRMFFKEPCCNGNYEFFLRLFTKYSIPFWILKSYSKRKDEYERFFIQNQSKGVCFARIRSEKELRKFLTALKEACSGSHDS